MVTPKQVEIPLYRGFGWCFESDAVHLHKFLGEPQFQCIVNVFPPSKSFTIDFFEVAAQEIEEVVSGWKKTWTLQRVWQREETG